MGTNLAGALGHGGQSGAGLIWVPALMDAYLEPGFARADRGPGATGVAHEIRPVLGCVGACVQRDTLGATWGLWSQPVSGMGQCWGLQ